MPVHSHELKGSVGSSGCLGLEAAEAVRDSGRFWIWVRGPPTHSPSMPQSLCIGPDAGSMGCGLAGKQRCRECRGGPLAKNTRGAIFLGGIWGEDLRLDKRHELI